MWTDSQGKEEIEAGGQPSLFHSGQPNSSSSDPPWGYQKEDWLQRQFLTIKTKQQETIK